MDDQGLLQIAKGLVVPSLRLINRTDVVEGSAFATAVVYFLTDDQSLLQVV